MIALKCLTLNNVFMGRYIGLPMPVCIYVEKLCLACNFSVNNWIKKICSADDQNDEMCQV